MAFRIETGAEPIPGYTLHSRLGSGGFGEVWKAEAPGGIFKAIKFIHGDLRDKTNDDIRFAEQELKALKRVQSVRHPYLLSLDRYDIIDGRLMITMELADCNLWEKFRLYRQQGYVGIPRDELIRLMAESAEVLDLMNDQYALQHLDIKPQNLFLLHNHVKVADFGQVKDLQGMGAAVTGGITPVYAAPETFDGFVSRFCDQYSLACVYQELLTGQRPFDGTSMQQLLMQHLNQPPNLSMVSSIDRPSINRALAKKPEDRFPNIMSFVRSLIEAGTAASAPRTITPSAIPQPRPKAAPTPLVNPSETSARIEISLPEFSIHSSSILSTSLTSAKPTGGSSIISGIPFGSGETPLPRGVNDTFLPPTAVAPVEETGEGSLRPTLVIGLGGIGQRVIRLILKRANDAFGKVDQLAVLKMIYIDTDSAAVEAAGAGRNIADLPTISADTIIHTKLNRASHYLKPRLSGRSLIEGWFDPTLLYRLPRNTVTQGIRIFGRLAYCDYYRTISQKISADLSVVLDPKAMEQTTMATGLEIRTNRPRVYIVAGLAGGTGSGMLQDAAYTVRAKLKQMGYANPEVVGILLVPPDSPAGQMSSLSQANVYAALTELNHFANEETQFTANYDERFGTIADPAPAFTQTILLQGPVVPVEEGSKSGVPAMRAPVSRGTVAVPLGYSSGLEVNLNRSATPSRDSWPQPFHGRSGSINYEMRSSDEDSDYPAVAADLIWYDLFTSLGPAAEEARQTLNVKQTASTFRTVGFTRFTWPRGEIVSRAAHKLSLVIFDGWVTPDVKRARGLVPGWTAEEWTRLGLDVITLQNRFREGVDKTLGGSVDGLFTSIAEGLTPKGWLARLPDANQLTAGVGRVTAIVGLPSNTTTTTLSPAETAIQKIAVDVLHLAITDLTSLIPARVDDPNFRLAGAEEAARGFLGIVERTIATVTVEINQNDKVGREGYDLLMHLVHFQRGMAKPTNEQFLAAIRDYPTSRYKALQLRYVLDIYTQLKTALTNLMNELCSCRKRLEMVRNQLASDSLPQSPPVSARVLMPPNCETVADSVNRFLSVLGDNDLTQIEHQVQSSIEELQGGVYQSCLNKTGGVEGLLNILREETRKYLDVKLGEVDLAGMFARRYPTEQAATNAIASAYHAAAPRLVESGPWARNQVAIIAGPSNASGETLRAAVAHAIHDDTPLRTTDIPDELTFYREYPAVPIQMLAQLGPTWQAAYQEINESSQGTPHIRTDIMKWVDVDN